MTGQLASYPAGSACPGLGVMDVDRLVRDRQIAC
jgi:hypothetical protein